MESRKGSGSRKEKWEIQTGSGNEKCDLERGSEKYVRVESESVKWKWGESVSRTKVASVEGSGSGEEK